MTWRLLVALSLVWMIAPAASASLQTQALALRPAFVAGPNVDVLRLLREATRQFDLGTIWFGRRWPPGNPQWTKPELDEVERQIDWAIEFMSNAEGELWLDTASSYGETEAILSQIFQRHPQWRKHIRVATKWGEIYDPISEKGTLHYTVENLRVSFERSRTFLGAIDLLYIHMPGAATIDVLRDPSLRAVMTELRDSGQVRLLGASISNPTLLTAAHQEGLLKEYNVIQMPADSASAHPELVLEFRRQGKAVVLNSPIRSFQVPADASPDIRDLLYRRRFEQLFAIPGVSRILLGTRHNLAKSVGYLAPLNPRPLEQPPHDRRILADS